MNFNRLPLVMAMAMATAVASPAAFAQSSVTVYGKLYPMIQNDSGSGATNGASSATLGVAGTGVNAIVRNTGMFSGNSRWGILGTEDLGGGMDAFFQMESVVGVNNGAGGLWDRDIFVGLSKKGVGSLKLGSMDTIFKNYGDTIGTLGVSSGTFLSNSNVLRKVGFGRDNSARFHERRANSIQLESDEMAGFRAGFQYSLDSAKTATRNATTTSLGLKYDNGPLYVSIAHEIHDDFFGGSINSPAALRNNADQAVNSKDKATQFAVEYRLGKAHKFSFDVITKEYDENATLANKFKSYKNTAIQLAMENRWSDQWRTSANYVRSNAGSCALTTGACVTNGLEANKFTLAAAYYFSRRTYAFGGVSKLTNGSAARFSTNPVANNSNPGEDVTYMALGLAHSF